MNQRKALAALAGGAAFEGADGTTVVEVFDVGEVSFPTGRIIACDPGRLTGDHHLEPLARTIPPGRYPVRVCVARVPAGGHRVALAALRISAAPPVRFEPAFRAGEDPAQFEAGELPAHGVDSATSCFVDVRVAEELAKRCQDWEYRWNGFIQLFGMDSGSEWKNVVLEPEAGLNFIEFKTGFGDGRYASYWGFDSRGEVACLVTDFELLGGSTCPGCDAEEGSPHQFLCEHESCPFCGGPIRTCGCEARVLGLGTDEVELLRRFQESFHLDPPRPGLLSWLASFFRPRRLLEPELAKVREIQKRWKQAADARGRIPYGPPGFCLIESDEEAETDDDDDADQPSKELEETPVTMGAMELGRFKLRARTVDPSSGGPEPVRRLVMPPTWSADRSVMVWNEHRGADDVKAVMWRPETASERAEAERLYEAARRRSWTTPDDLRALLNGPGPWLLRLNMFGVLKYLTENREEILFAPDSDDQEAPETLADEPEKGATFTREQVLDFIPRLWEEWLQRDEDFYFEPVRPEQTR
jgi:hypothetical protein